MGMNKHRLRRHPIEIVYHGSQNEEQRHAMIMMQLDMALAMARQKNMAEMEGHFEHVLTRMRKAHNSRLH